MMTLGEFMYDVLTHADEKSKEWRFGQVVFNYIDEVYGVAREVQFTTPFDCFYKDDNVRDFIEESYKVYVKKFEKYVKNTEKDLNN